MIMFTAGQCAEVIKATLVNCLPDVPLMGVCTDSRKVKPGDLFVTIRGTNFDGLDFVGEALESGASAVLSKSPTDGVPSIVCHEGAFRALQLLAIWHRSLLVGATVVGVTGSAGKTITKDMIAAVLSGAGPVIATLGSANNELGLPLTLLSADANTCFLVVELGARHVGDIAELVDIAKPDVGVVTNVGSAHIEIFGTIENTARTKAELVADLPAKGWAILNADDQRVVAMAENTVARVVTFGSSPGADVMFSEVEVSHSGHTSCTISSRLASGDQGSQKVVFELAGRHLVSNAAAAIAVGLCLGVDLVQGCQALSQMSFLSPHRAKVIESGGVTIIDDTYNANPESMAAAVAMLAEVAGNRRKLAVLGDMGELGDKSQIAHEQIGALVAKAGVSVVIGVGELAKFYLRDQISPVQTIQASDSDSAISVLKSVLTPGDVVLIKASRAIGLDAVVHAFTDDRAQATP